MKIPNAKFNNKEGDEGEIMKIRGVGKRGHKGTWKNMEVND